MSKGAIITLIVLVVGVLGGLMGMKMHKQGQSSAKARGSAVELLQSSPTYQSSRDYIEGLIDQHHQVAFEAAYKSGGLSQIAEYDEEVYFAELWTRMAASAEQDQRHDVVQILPGQAKGRPGGGAMPKPTG